MKKVKVFFMAVILVLSCGVVHAQSYSVSGTIYDATSHEPIPFASVMVEGTMIGSASDAEGNYTISVKNLEKSTLVFSSVGYKSLSVPVDGRVKINCDLNIDATALDDVVVVAYGSAKKEAVTGSVSSMKAEGIASTPVTSIDKALSGKLAGVQVTASSSQPGSPSQIRIRGNSSITAGNAPLWVVDGIPFTAGSGSLLNMDNGLATLNPNDIESITVLKDAAAAAVYGSRAANGVILVTTKSGKAGKASFEARAKVGVSWIQSDSGFGIMNGEQLLGYQRDAVRNAGLDPDDPTCPYYRPMSLLTVDQTNWFDYLTKPGLLQEYEINARGGNARGSYFSSVSFQSNKGIADGIDFKRVQARVNADYKLLNSLTTGARINMAYIDQNETVFLSELESRNPMWAGVTILPWTQKYGEDGDHNMNIPENFNINPKIAPETNIGNSKIFRVNGTAFLRWEPIPHLVLETRNSAEMSFSNERRYVSSKSSSYQKDAFAASTMSWMANLTTSNTINYSDVIDLHSFRVLAGQEATYSMANILLASSQGVDPKIPYVHTALPENTSVDVGIGAESLLSFFGIADYNYDNRYFVQATVRGDGSSLFGAKNKWGVFGSASASWNISSEKWFQNVRFMDLLKLRASYGVNGNNGIGQYAAYGVYDLVKYNGSTGILPSTPENQELSWEKNATWNVGLDFSFLRRINGSLDIYKRYTTDMLLNKRIPQTSGFSSTLVNTGKLNNFGVEFQLNADIVQTKDLNWNVGFNIAHNQTKLIDLGDKDVIERNSFIHHVVGKSMYTFYLADYYGVNPSNGEALWVAEDMSLTSNYNKARKYYAGSPEPKVIGGFNTTLSWKGLSLSAFFEFKAGCYVFLPNENSYMNSDGKEMNMNQMVSALNYWKKPGDVGVNPKPVAGNASHSNEMISDRWLERGDYLRFKDITLSYSLPQNALSKMHVKGLRFYVSGLNLYCWNDVNFWDPELGILGLTGGDYPLTKSFVGGIELTF